MSLSHVSMMAFRTAAACALLALPVFPVRADYIADTGRTQKQEVSSESIGELSAPADAAPVASVELHDLYDAAVEKALLESGIERLAVNSEGINTSIRTFADYQVNSITGQGRLKMADGKRIDPLYAVLGMIYQNKAWVHAPIIPVENAELAARMGLNPKTHNRVSPVWVMKTPAARNLVMPLLSGGKSPDMGLSEDEKKALDRFAYRIGAFLSLPNEFKLVPVMGEVRDEWVAPSHLTNPSSVNDHELQHKVAALDTSRDPYAATISLDKAIRSAYDDKNTTQVAGAVAAFIKTVDGTPEYMTTSVRKLDYWNTVIQPFKKAALLSMFSFFAFVIYLMTVRRRDTRGQAGSGSGSGEEPRQPLSETEGSPVDKPSLVSALVGTPAMATAGGAGIMAFDGGAQAIPATGGGPVLRIPGAGGGADYGDPTLQAELEMNKGSRAAWGLAYLLLAASAGMMVAALVTRFIIGGRMPVSNMYESITFAMAAFAIVSLVFEGIHRRGWVGVGAAFAGWGLMTLANSMPLHMRKVEPLVAVLKSVWLNYHVTALLISYSAFLLAFVCGILYFIKDLTGNRPGGLPRKEVFEYLSYRAIQVGWPLLTLGIFLGAVWANTAWGSYWSWDPKETWALITWFAYTIYLHFRMILGWTNRKAVLANILGFLMVLITYFGVSYLPGLSGGMHSYAAPISK